MSKERDPSRGTPNHNLRRGVALGVLAGLSFVGWDILNGDGQQDPHLQTVTCERHELHMINTSDGNPNNDTVSGIIASEVTLAPGMTYGDVIGQTQVYLKTTDGIAHPATADLPNPIRTGDYVVSPETCEWTNGQSPEVTSNP